MNGRIVIVDDKLNEAEPLIRIFSKKRIPINYYSGERSSDFPDNPNENKIRVLFLDLNIIESQREIKSVISTLDPIIRAIVPENPNPYLLVIWSKKNNEYAEALETHIEANIPDRIPAKVIFLHKGDYFDYIDGMYQPQTDCIEKIEQKLNEELSKISLLRNLIVWENIVHQKATETISEFSSFYPINESWDKNSKGLIYRLAKAIVGVDEISSTNNELKLAKAFINVNAFLFDKLESEIENFKLGVIEDIPNKDEDALISSNIQSRINSTLHISQRPLPASSFEQGNVYQIPDEDSCIRRITWDNLFSPPNPAKMSELRATNPLLIQLDITPVCDYSQDKRYVRLIYGLLINPLFVKHFKSSFYYKTPVMHIMNEERCMVFDFRYIKTLSKPFLIQRGIAPLIKLRREICTDIQSQLANQINRPGISNV